MIKDSTQTIMDIVRHESPRLLKQTLRDKPTWNLLDHGFLRYTPLIEAVSIERLDMVVTISEHVIDYHGNMAFFNYLNHTTSDGKNALMVGTCMNSDIQVIEYLISNGADWKKKDTKGFDINYFARLSPSEKIEDFWNNFNPNNYQEKIKHYIEQNSIRKRSGNGRMLF
jgi:hypothetical protein